MAERECKNKKYRILQFYIFTVLQFYKIEKYDGHCTQHAGLMFIVIIYKYGHVECKINKRNVHEFGRNMCRNKEGRRYRQEWEETVSVMA
jgi:hypothetical protein